MSTFVLHPDALADLAEIWEFIAADNPGAADRVLDEIQEAIRALIPLPQAGHRRPDLTSRPLRFHPVRDFLIAYAPDEKPLVVLAILHGRRNPRVMATSCAKENNRNIARAAAHVADQPDRPKFTR